VAITFQKRQKEMKRMEKQRAKAERRAQKKIERQDGTKPPEDDLGEPLTGPENILPPDSPVS
jgi:hypothetical protein